MKQLTLGIVWEQARREFVEEVRAEVRQVVREEISAARAARRAESAYETNVHHLSAKLTTEQVAAAHGLSRKTVTRQCREGALKAGWNGRGYLIDPKDAEAFFGALKPKKKTVRPLDSVDVSDKANQLVRKLLG